MVEVVPTGASGMFCGAPLDQDRNHSKQSTSHLPADNLARRLTCCGVVGHGPLFDSYWRWQEGAASGLVAQAGCTSCKASDPPAQWPGVRESEPVRWLLFWHGASRHGCKTSESARPFCRSGTPKSWQVAWKKNLTPATRSPLMFKRGRPRLAAATAQ